MQLKELVKMLRAQKMKRIVVTGPRMSGTKIGAYVLAERLKLPFFAEEFFGVDDLDGFLEKVAIEKEFVCQCPELIQSMRCIPDDILIIAMDRPLGDILLEQRKWGYIEKEHSRFYEEEKLYDMTTPLAHIQSQHLEYFISKNRRIEYLEYDSISSEKIFLSVAARRKLKSGRIFINGKTPESKDFRKAK